MPELPREPYGFRANPDVPAFDDARALFVFDGVCALCSTGARWLMRADQRSRVNFASSQSPLGAALYRHYGVDPNDTYLFIVAGRAFSASRGYLEMFRVLGGAWSVLRVAAVVPEAWRDVAYRALARNRYRLFGRVEYCALLTAQERARLLG